MMINDKCVRKLWDPISTSKFGILFSHLFYVDDIILFAKANRKNCIAIQNTLQELYEMSNLKVNF